MNMRLEFECISDNVLPFQCVCQMQALHSSCNDAVIDDVFIKWCIY